MTSTNDGKDVKSNHTSGQKGKTYYIELYKSLDAQLSAGGSHGERVTHLCSAWRNVHTLCLHSAQSTHPHLINWILRYTATTVLQSTGKEEQPKLEQAFDDFTQECHTAAETRNGVVFLWESELVARAAWFKGVLSNLWGHPVLQAFSNWTGECPSTEEILEWLKEERGIFFAARLRQLALSKCEDIALRLVSTVMDNVRATREVLSDLDLADDKQTSVSKSEDPTFESILSTEAGFSDVWDQLTDIELVLLHKNGQTAKVIDLAKLLPLANGKQIVDRLLNRLESAPREKKLWKNAKDVAILVTQVMITRCMVVPVCAGGVRPVLYWCARALVRALPASAIARAANTLAAPASSARHLHTLATAVHAQQNLQSDDLKPFVVELYVRAITVGMNELEKLKLKPEYEEKEARATEQTLASWFIQLGQLLSRSARMRCECVLTAFSVHPSPAMYERIKSAPVLPPVALDIQPKKEPETASEFGSWASDSRTQTNFVKTSEHLNIQQTQHQANVLSTALLIEGEALGLDAELCQDITVLLSGPRVKTLSWDVDRQVLLANCVSYMERTAMGTRALTTELRYLHLDPASYQHLPEGSDDDDDVYYGIEKGYEHLVELEPQPEQIWEDAYYDLERTESAYSSECSQSPAPRRKKKTKHRPPDTDPLSTDKKEKKERPHSKERSKERKKKTKDDKNKDDKNKEDKEHTERRKDEVKEKKKERKKREKKEKKAKNPLIGVKLTTVSSANENSHNISIAESDNSRKNSTSENVVYDGQFSMDELKSPDRSNEDSNKSEIAAITPQQAQSPNMKMTHVQTPVTKYVPNMSRSNNAIKEEVKRNITKLLQFRRQKMSESSNSPVSSPNQSDKGLGGQNAPFSPAGTKMSQSSNLYLNKKQHDLLNTMKEANPLKAIYYPGELKTASTCSRVQPFNPASSRKTPWYSAQMPSTSQHSTHFNFAKQVNQQGQDIRSMPAITQKSPLNKSTHLSSYEKFLQELKSKAHSGIDCATPLPKTKKGKQMKPISKVTPVIPHTMNTKAHVQSAVPNMVETEHRSTPNVYPMKNDPRINPTMHNMPKTETAVGLNVQNMIKADTGITVYDIIKAEVKAAPTMHHTVKQEPMISQCAKSVIQSKKVENAPNTFARLSYMHKNKLNDKSKQLIDATCSLQTSVSEELDRRIAELKLTKMKMYSNKKEHSASRISSVAQSTPAKETPRVECEKIENMSSSQMLNQQHPLLASILKNVALTVKSSMEMEKSRANQKNTALTEKDQQDLLKLLNQKNILNKPIQQPITNKILNSQFVNNTSNIDTNKCIAQPETHPYNPPVAHKVAPKNEQATTALCKETEVRGTSSKFPVISNTTIKKTMAMVQHKVSPMPLNMQCKRQSAAIRQAIIEQDKTVLEVNKAISKKYVLKPPVTTPQYKQIEQEQEWTKVMDALRSHKTPSRGPNALNMLYNKDSFEKVNERNQLINSSKTTAAIRAANDILKQTLPIDSQGNSATPTATSKTLMTGASAPIDCQTGTKDVLKDLPKKQSAPVARKASPANPLIIYPDVVKQPRQMEVHKEDDPFISGIPNSDYEILEELMDDDLRQEIGELLSDEESYRTATVSSSKSLNNANKNQSVTKKVSAKKAADPWSKPCVIKTSTPINTPIPIHTSKSINKSTTSPIPQSTKAKPQIISNEKVDIRKLSKSLIGSRVFRQEPTTMASKLQDGVIYNVNNTVASTNASLTTPTTFYNAAPASVHNMVIIDAYGMSKNVNQSYVSVNNSPNVVYQQFTAPVASQIIIRNNIVPIPTAIQSAATVNVVYDNAPQVIDVPTMHIPETTPMPIPAISMPASIVVPNLNQIQLVVDKPLEAVDEKPLETMNAKVIDITEKGLDTPREVTKSKDPEFKTNPKPTNIVPIEAEKCVVDPKLTYDDISTIKIKERKVLSEVQEKLTEIKVDTKVPEKKDPIKNIKLKSTFQSNKNEEAYKKDQERLTKKRLTILNRKNHNFSSVYPVIPLTYSPIIAVYENESVFQNKSDSSKFGSNKAEVIQCAANQIPVKPIQSRNEIEIKESCSIKLRSTNKVEPKMNQIENNQKLVGQKTKVRLKNVETNHCLENNNAGSVTNTKLVDVNFTENAKKLNENSALTTVKDKEEKKKSDVDKAAPTRLSKRILNKKIKKTEEKEVKSQSMETITDDIEKKPVSTKINVGQETPETFDLEEAIVGAVISKTYVDKNVQEKKTRNKVKNIKKRKDISKELNILKTSKKDHEEVDLAANAVNNENINIPSSHEIGENSEMESIVIESKNEKEGAFGQNSILSLDKTTLTSEKSVSSKHCDVNNVKLLSERKSVVENKMSKLLDEIESVICAITESTISSPKLEADGDLNDEVVKVNDEISKVPSFHTPAIAIQSENHENMAGKCNKANDNKLGHTTSQSDVVKEQKNKISENTKLDNKILSEAITVNSIENRKPPEDIIISSRSIQREIVGDSSITKNTNPVDSVKDKTVPNSGLELKETVNSPQNKSEDLIDKYEDKSTNHIKVNKNDKENTIKTIADDASIQKISKDTDCVISDELQKNMANITSVNENTFLKNRTENRDKDAIAVNSKSNLNSNTSKMLNGRSSAKTNVNENKSKTSDIPQSLKDSIKINEIPIPGNKDPNKRCVRITLPNNKTFKATVHGTINVSFDTLFKDPALKNILLNSINDTQSTPKQRITLNIQLATSENRIVENCIQGINVHGKKSTPETVDVVNLVSDDEDEPDQLITTESGSFKVKFMDQNVLKKHQHKLSQKCVIKLKRCDDKPKTGVLVEALIKDLGIMIPPQAEIIEIDDSSSDGESSAQTGIDVLKDILLKELGVINPLQNNIIDENLRNDSMDDNHNANQLTNERPSRTRKSKYHRERSVRPISTEPARCSISQPKMSENQDNSETDIQKDRSKIITRECYIKLINCDNLVNDLCKVQDSTNQDIISVDDDSFDSEDNMPLMSRSGSFSILNELDAFNEPLVPADGTNSPVMEAYDMIVTLQNKPTNDVHILAHRSINNSLCQSDWFDTKSILHVQNVANRIRNIDDIFKEIVQNKVYCSTDCDTDAATDLSIYNENTNVPSLISIMSKYFEDNPIVYKLQSISEMNNFVKAPLKRKSQDTINRLSKKVSKISSHAPTLHRDKSLMCDTMEKQTATIYEDVRCVPLASVTLKDVAEQKDLTRQPSTGSTVEINAVVKTSNDLDASANYKFIRNMEDKPSDQDIKTKSNTSPVNISVENACQDISVLCNDDIHMVQKETVATIKYENFEECFHSKIINTKTLRVQESHAISISEDLKKLEELSTALDTPTLKSLSGVMKHVNIPETAKPSISARDNVSTESLKKEVTDDTCAKEKFQDSPSDVMKHNDDLPETAKPLISVKDNVLVNSLKKEITDNTSAVKVLQDSPSDMTKVSNDFPEIVIPPTSVKINISAESLVTEYNTCAVEVFQESASDVMKHNDDLPETAKPLISVKDNVLTNSLKKEITDNTSAVKVLQDSPSDMTKVNNDFPEIVIPPTSVKVNISAESLVTEYNTCAVEVFQESASDVMKQNNDLPETAKPSISVKDDHSTESLVKEVTDDTKVFQDMENFETAMSQFKSGVDIPEIVVVNNINESGETQVASETCNISNTSELVTSEKSLLKSGSKNTEEVSFVSKDLVDVNDVPILEKNNTISDIPLDGHMTVKLDKVVFTDIVEPFGTAVPDSVQEVSKIDNVQIGIEMPEEKEVFANNSNLVDDSNTTEHVMVPESIIPNVAESTVSVLREEDLSMQEEKVTDKPDTISEVIIPKSPSAQIIDISAIHEDPVVNDDSTASEHVMRCETTLIPNSISELRKPISWNDRPKISNEGYHGPLPMFQDTDKSPKSLNTLVDMTKDVSFISNVSATSEESNIDEKTTVSESDEKIHKIKDNKSVEKLDKEKTVSKKIESNDAGQIDKTIIKESCNDITTVHDENCDLTNKCVDKYDEFRHSAANETTSNSENKDKFHRVEIHEQNSDQFEIIRCHLTKNLDSKNIQQTDVKDKTSNCSLSVNPRENSQEITKTDSRMSPHLQVPSEVTFETVDEDNKYVYETEVVVEVQDENDDDQISEILSEEVQEIQVTSDLLEKDAIKPTYDSSDNEEIIVEKSIEEVDCDENVFEKNATLVYKDDSGVILKGIQYDDPEIGTCYVFPLVKSSDESEASEVLGSSFGSTIEVIQEVLNTTNEDDIMYNTELYDETDLEVIEPKVTYSKRNLKRKSGMRDVTCSEKRSKKSLKSNESSEIRLIKKKYRKSKNIDAPKWTALSITQTGDVKDFKRRINYYSTVGFSYSITYSTEFIDASDLLKKWPITGPVRQEIGDEDETGHALFAEIDNVENPTRDPLRLSLMEELSAKYDDIDYPNWETEEIKFNMGFGEGSGRVKQNLDGGTFSKISAATLSDVKQTQPCLQSENYFLKSSKHDQLRPMKQYLTCMQLKEKVRSFFKSTTFELTCELDKKDDSENYDKSSFPFELFNSKCFEPSPSLFETVVQVVQVGQLPVSAAAQNPVTCDPRVTQVSDASPSQCSVENSPHDDSQPEIKTEYTELTTADLSIPLVEDYVHHNQTPVVSQESINISNNENIPIQTELVKSEVKIEIVEESPDEKENNETSDANNHINNVEYLYEANNTNPSVESDFQALFDSDKQDTSESNVQHKSQNGSEKTDQIAHAMTAAGITTTSESRAQALVNILTQKLRQGAIATTPNSTNNYPKATSINAMSLQQALASILPPPLNQTSSSENHQQGQNTVAPQVLHIVQGKNASGNQITLVDNTQQSVITTPNATPVLHIVQNKATAPVQNSNGSPAPQSNTFSGLSLVDAGLQQGGNQLLHIVNTGNQKNNNPSQLLKRVNLLTNLANVQGSNEQKMVQFVCKSADGKAIQLNAPHQRSMVLRLQPIESPNVQSTTPKPVETNQDMTSSQSATNSAPNKDSGPTQQEIKSRSVYEENYAKFIQNSSNKPTLVERSNSLPKFNQAFGKAVFQDENQKQNEMNSNSLPSVNTNTDSPECPATDNAINLDHIGQISSPPLLLRKSPVQTTQAQQNLVQQIKQTIAPMNIQTMHGGVIYTRQIPVNIGGGQTINLITVPSTELIDESGQKQQVNQGETIEPSIIKIVPQSQPPSNADISDDMNNDNAQQSTPQPQPVLTQMRIKLPMLSKTPQMLSGARVVRPSFFQIQRNVIGGGNQAVYQQLVLTAAPPLGQQTIRLPQAQARQIKVPENQSSSESQMSSSTLEQLREFDMVLEQVKERSTVQPNSNSSSSFKLHTTSTDTTDSPTTATTTSAEKTQVLYSIGSSQPLNVTYVNRKPSVSTPTTSTFVRSPDSSGIADSPTSSSSHSHIPHTSTSEASASETTHHKPVKVSSKSKSRPKSSSHPPNSMKLNNVPPKTSTQKPLEDEQTTQRILYILAEYKEQVENSPDKDKPAPRRRTNPPSNPGSSKRKKSSSGSRRSGRDMSPIHGDDTCRTMGSEDSSCGTSQGDCTESCMDSHSPQDSPRKVARKLAFEPDPPAVTPPKSQPQRNVIVADGQTITVARGTAGKPATAVLMPANYILPVSMVKGGQQIAIVTNRGPKLLTVGGGEGGATNALLLQRLIGPAGLKPVLTRPGVRHVRLPTAALHNLQAFNLASATSVQPPDSTASPAPDPPQDHIDTNRAGHSPWTEREMEIKPDRASSPDESEPWNMPSSADPHDYTYEETVRADNMNRTVLDPIQDRYSPDMEAQRIFDKMFDVDTKKSYIVDSPRCAYDIDASDCDDKPYQVVHKKDNSHRQTRLSHVSAAALRHKYAILEHELRLQKSLSEECEDLGVDSPSASELFPEAELLFAASPAQDHGQDTPQHSHTPQPTLLNQSVIQPDIDDQIATDQLLPRHVADDRQELDVNLGLEDVGIVTVSEDGMQATIAVDQEEFARAHPNTTFHSEPTEEGEIQPFTITGLKTRHITSTIFHSNRAPATVLMTAPQTTVISQATAETSHNAVKYSEIDNMIHALPSTHTNNINLSSVLVKDDGLTRFDSILTDSRELHLSNTASAIVHSAGNATQVIRRVCYEDNKRERESFLMDEPDALIAGDDAKMVAEDSSRDATLESMGGDDDNSSPERHAELFWESNSASERSESRRPLDFSSDSEKCCKSPSYDETNSTDSSGVGTHMRLDSVIKEARGVERSGSADGSSADDTHPPLRTYPPKRLYYNVQGEMERSLSGKTRAGERSPDIEVRRRASGRGVVKRGCHCCNGSPAPPRPKKTRQRKPTMDFTN